MASFVAARYPASVAGDQSNPRDPNFVNVFVRLHGGEAAIPPLRRDIARLTGRSDIDIWDLPSQFSETQRQISFESRCLLALAGAAFAATLFLLGQRRVGNAGDRPGDPAAGQPACRVAGQIGGAPARSQILRTE